jgi:hypothetical protein
MTFVALEGVGTNDAFATISIGMNCFVPHQLGLGGTTNLGREGTISSRTPDQAGGHVRRPKRRLTQGFKLLRIRHPP